MAETCDTCIHTKVCELWRLQECQDASCFFRDGCGLYREDAEPSKHGHWIMYAYDEAICSECGYESTDPCRITDNHKCCEYCGARMIVVNEFKEELSK